MIPAYLCEDCESLTHFEANPYIETVEENAFAGMVNARVLWLYGNIAMKSLPNNIFSCCTPKTEDVGFWGLPFEKVPDVSNLPDLRILWLGEWVSC